MTVFQLAMIFFIVTNPIGNSPAIISLIKQHPIKEQQKILFRESLFAMILAIFFLFLGEAFLSGLSIKNYALTLSGGMILFITSLNMIFSESSDDDGQNKKQTPFIVPIATPLLSGAGLLTMIMLYSKAEDNDLKLLSAILIAWIGVTGVLVVMPYVQVFLGKRGMAAVEQLMGMLLAMISIGMIVQGISMFISIADSN